MENNLVVVMLGPTGVGKSTIAKKINESFTNEHCKIVSSGDVARSIHSSLSKEEVEFDIEYISKHGISQYNDKIESVVIENITFECDRFVILDGYPRNVEQLQRLLSVKSKFLFINMSVPIDVLMSRLINRARYDLDTSTINRTISSQKRNVYEMVSIINDIKNNWELYNNNAISLNIINLNDIIMEDIDEVIKYVVASIKFIKNIVSTNL